MPRSVYIDIMADGVDFIETDEKPIAKTSLTKNQAIVARKAVQAQIERENAPLVEQKRDEEMRRKLEEWTQTQKDKTRQETPVASGSNTSGD